MKVSLYAEYVNERGLEHIIESDAGFATYRYINDGRTVYIIDIYVRPEMRKFGEASKLAGIIAAEARSRGATEMWGTVAPQARGSTDSVRVLLAYGMDLLKIEGDLVVFRKDL